MYMCVYMCMCMYIIYIIYIIILYYIILYYVILYYIILYYVILYYTMLYYIILCYVILYYIIIYYIILYYVMLYYIILCYIILYYILLYYIILYYIWPTRPSSIGLVKTLQVIILDRNGLNNTQQLLGFLAARSGLPWPGVRAISPLDSNLHGMVGHFVWEKITMFRNLSTKENAAASRRQVEVIWGADHIMQQIFRRRRNCRCSSRAQLKACPTQNSRSRQPLWKPDPRCCLQLFNAVQLLQVSLFDVIILKLQQNCHSGCSGFNDNGDVWIDSESMLPGFARSGDRFPERTPHDLRVDSTWPIDNSW